MSLEKGSRPVLVLGTEDHEMNGIERLWQRAGLPYVYAVGNEGKRVTYAEANGAPGVSDPALIERCGGGIITVECCVPDLASSCVDEFDHHRPGHKGYNGAPSEAWYLSSFGQAVESSYFKHTVSPLVTPSDRVIGALDDNPRAVFQDLVPGANPKLASDVLLEGIGVMHGLNLASMRTRYDNGSAAFESLHAMKGWDGKVVDARSIGASLEEYNALNRLLYLAHAYHSGVGVLTHCVEGKPKLTVNGADEKGVANFIEFAQPLIRNGEATGLYANDRRGFAGIYIDPESDYAYRFGLKVPDSSDYNQLVTTNAN